MSQELKEWQVPTLCKCCNDLIYSRYDGEYRSCHCGKCAVDQTPYYFRHIGAIDLMERLDESFRD